MRNSSRWKNDEGRLEAGRVCARELCDERKHGYRDLTRSRHGHHAGSSIWIHLSFLKGNLQFSVGEMAYNKDVTFVMVNVRVTDGG
jgi:hypothetical protein